MCQLVTLIFSNLGPSTNLLLTITKGGALNHVGSHGLEVHLVLGVLDGNSMGPTNTLGIDTQDPPTSQFPRK